MLRARMPTHSLLYDLVVVLAAAVAVVLALHRLKLPTIAGFLVAGALVGPSGASLVQDSERIEVLAEIGVVLLLFTIGLEFSLAHLRRIARMVCVGGSLQVGLTGLATFGVARLLEVDTPRAVFFGFLVALSSTAIVLRGLSERGELEAPHGRLIVGVLLFQDLCVVPMMLLVPMLADETLAARAIVLALLQAAVVMSITVALARFVVPRVFRVVAATRRREVFLLTVVLVCAGIAWATSLVGLSLALGAFLAGLVLADSEYGHQALADVLPLRDLFTSLFFVSMGMLLDLELLAREPLPVLGLVGALLVGKFGLAALAGTLMRMPLRVALLAGAALAQIGEFSFVLADLGHELRLIDTHERGLFLDASVLTMLITPLLLRVGPHLAAGAQHLVPLERGLGLDQHASPQPGSGAGKHVVVLGFGVGGELLVHTLRRESVPYALVDLSVERVRAGRERGEPVWYGDSTSPDILERVHVRDAALVAVLLNDPEATLRSVRAVRKLAPQVPIVVRARHLADGARLRAAGASYVVAQDVEASIRVIRDVFAQAGRQGAELARVVDAARGDIGTD